MSVEYETSFSDWRSVCPYDEDQRTIEFRSKQMLQKIKMAGLGDRLILRFFLSVKSVEKLFKKADLYLITLFLNYLLVIFHFYLFYIDHKYNAFFFCNTT